jgi:hypothetical protein
MQSKNDKLQEMLEEERKKCNDHESVIKDLNYQLLELSKVAQIKGEVATEEHENEHEHEHDDLDGDVGGEGGINHRKHDKKHHAGVKHKHGKRHNNNNNNNHDVTSSDNAPTTTHDNDDHNDNHDNDGHNDDHETTAVIEALHLELNQLKVKVSELESVNCHLNQSMV